MKSFIIGIDGGSCSGKTTLANMICERFNATVIHRDNYYLSHDDISLEKRKYINYDVPEAFENDLLISHLLNLKNGIGVDSPVYDYTVHNRSKNVVHIDPAEIMIVDGIILFSDKRLRDCFDLKVFIDVDSDTRLARRIARDTKMRGRTADDIREQFYATVKPMHELYIEPFKNMADIVIKENEFENVLLRIESMMKRKVTV